jgi:hypothetical protein
MCEDEKKKSAEKSKKGEKLVWQNNFYDLKQMCDENGKRISLFFFAHNFPTPSSL